MNEGLLLKNSVLLPLCRFSGFDKKIFILYLLTDDDMYGNAPWMGTLRHVTHENKVVQSYKSPQFKKYPDEDAPNPFQVNTTQKIANAVMFWMPLWWESVNSPVSCK